MSVYKKDHLTARMLRFHYTDEKKIAFLKDRVRLFLIANKGYVFDRWDVTHQMELPYNVGELVQKAIDLLLADEKSGVRSNLHKDKVTFPRESQYVY